MVINDSENEDDLFHNFPIFLIWVAICKKLYMDWLFYNSMFKKKIKKDQGVLNIEEEVKPTLEIASISPNAPHLSSIHSELIAPSHLDHHSNSKFIQQNCN